jgi:hypothetical protein
MADFWGTGALDAELARRRERLATELAGRPNQLGRLRRSSWADRRRTRAAAARSDTSTRPPRVGHSTPGTVLGWLARLGRQSDAGHAAR